MCQTIRLARSGFLLFLVLFAASAGPAQDIQRRPAASPAPPRFPELPVHFVKNGGQFPAPVKYHLKGARRDLFFLRSGMIHVLHGPDSDRAVRLDFVNARREVRIEARQEQAALVSCFLGSNPAGHAGLPTFRELVYRELWPGIDLAYRTVKGELKYEFLVRPGADPSSIRFRYRGATALEITRTRALCIRTSAGAFEDAAPVAWQEDDRGARLPVEAAYGIRAGHTVTFELGDYDRDRPLILDPAVLVGCGYLGGPGSEAGSGRVAVDASGHIYVTGVTTSTRFAQWSGPFAPRGNDDAFVAKLNPAGTSLIYLVLIGGSRHDHGLCVAVDSVNRAYVAGRTSSPNLPATVGPGLQLVGVEDGFVARINANGTALDYCGYLGGSGIDACFSIAVHPLGTAVVGGYTTSTDFPVLHGPGLTPCGQDDGFVAEINTQGSALLYSGYIGGSERDRVHGVAVDGNGNAYVTGWTLSAPGSPVPFPVRVGPSLTYGGNGDAFVAKVGAGGTSLLYCGYVGGENTDDGQRIAVDAAGAAFMAGWTLSDERSFPVKAGPDLTQNGAEDGFVARVNPSGQALTYCGYVGGSDRDKALDIALDGNGSAYVAGWTHSTDFPIVNAPGMNHVCGYDAFLAMVHPGGAGLAVSGCIGGAGTDFGLGMALGPTGRVHLVGNTDSPASSFPVLNGPGLVNQGGTDAFLARVDLTLAEVTGTPARGRTLVFDITASSDAGRPFQLASSLGTGPIPLGSRALGLTGDSLFFASVLNTAPGLFSNYSGVVSAAGKATIAPTLTIPNTPTIVGLRVHSAFVTLQPSAPLGIGSISNTCSFTIR